MKECLLDQNENQMFTETRIFYFTRFKNANDYVSTNLYVLIPTATFASSFKCSILVSITYSW